MCCWPTEQLERIEEDMDRINADMREAEKNLSGMEQCCGICTCPCNKSAEFKEDASTWKSTEDGKVVNSQPARVMDERNGAGPMSGYIAKVTNDAREEEMEENMGQVNTMIGNLRNMAIDMGSEIENQNRQLDRINQKVNHKSCLACFYQGVASTPTILQIRGFAGGGNVLKITCLDEFIAFPH
ncbi:SNAP25 [Cordylochernes scorpioides]|uniref:Synaptosomal-associated protein n=1 Tax=Cordylochernes scorpioides TaxID=51811 RepID=A0ABY6LJ89_9ARAC|nr:SNAP25 [Cordylochernes scorpioides]